jgi:hypothetical protein
VILQPTEYGSYVCPDDPGEPTTGIRRISVTDEECRFLNVLARGKHVVEIGTGLGISTRALAGGALTVRTIDIDPWVRDNIFPTLPDNVIGHWFDIETDDEVEWPVVDGDVGLVFIDGEHTPQALTSDLQFAESFAEYTDTPLLIVCHDAKMPEVADALDDEWIHVDTHHGLAIKIV